MFNSTLTMDEAVFCSVDGSIMITEPPDIINWFSSYVYESPVSGTSSQFEDSVSSSRPFTEKEVLPSIYTLSESQAMQNFRQAFSGPRQIFSLLNLKRLKKKKKKNIAIRG